MTHPEPTIFLSHLSYSYPSFTSFTCQRRVRLVLPPVQPVCTRHHFKMHPLRRKHVAVLIVPIKISYVLVSDRGSYLPSLYSFIFSLLMLQLTTTTLCCILLITDAFTSTSGGFAITNFYSTASCTGDSKNPYVLIYNYYCFLSLYQSYCMLI